MRFFVAVVFLLSVAAGCSRQVAERPREYVCSAPDEAVVSCPPVGAESSSSLVLRRGDDHPAPAAPEVKRGPEERGTEDATKPAKPKSVYDGLRALVEFNEPALCRQQQNDSPWDAVKLEVDSIITQYLREKGALRLIPRDARHRPPYDVLFAVCLSVTDGGYAHIPGGGIRQYVAQVIIKETRDGRAVSAIGSGSEYFFGQEFNGGIYRFEGFQRATRAAIRNLSSSVSRRDSLESATVLEPNQRRQTK